MTSTKSRLDPDATRHDWDMGRRARRLCLNTEGRRFEKMRMKRASRRHARINITTQIKEHLS